MNVTDVKEHIEVCNKIADFSRARFEHWYYELDRKSMKDYEKQLIYKQKELLCNLIMDCNDIDQLTVMTIFNAVVCDKMFVNRDSVEYMHFEPLAPKDKLKPNQTFRIIKTEQSKA